MTPIEIVLKAFDNLVNSIANWLEFIGFITTCIIAIKVFFINREVKRISTQHLFQVRIDDHLEELKKSSRRIANLLNNFQQNIKILRIEISQCLEHCQSIRNKVKKEELKNLIPIIKRMKKIKKNNLSQDGISFIDRVLRKKPFCEADADTVYIDLSSLITEIENYQIDLKKAIK